MRFGRRRFEKHAAQAAAGGPQGSWIPNISPYKDGAYPRSDANSFLAIPELDAGNNKEQPRNPKIKIQSLRTEN